MGSSTPLDGSQSTWHLCWHAALGRDLFTDDHLYRRVRDRVIEAHSRRGRQLIDYLLLPREIHVVSRVAAGDTPGNVARGIGNIVARWVREQQPVRSPVFAGPFVAIRLSSESEILESVRILAWRPVWLGLRATPVHHPHSALRTTLGLRPAQGFDARPLLHLFSESVRDARAALRGWLAKPPSDVQRRQWELLCGLELPGTAAFGPRSTREIDVAGLVAAGGDDGVNGALRLLETWVGTRIGSMSASEVHRSRSVAAARARGLVACLAVDHGLCPAAVVARFFGKAKATISEQMKACRRRPADRVILARPLRQLMEEVAGLVAS